MNSEKITNLKRERANHIGRLLLDLSQDFHRQSIQRIQEKTAEKIRSSCYDLLPFLDTEGTATAEIVKRSGLSKQAVAKTLTQMELDGIIERVVSAQDSRAKKVYFTSEGLHVLQTATESTAQTASLYASLLGEEDFEMLKTLLDRLLSARKLKRDQV